MELPKVAEITPTPEEPQQEGAIEKSISPKKGRFPHAASFAMVNAPPADAPRSSKKDKETMVAPEDNNEDKKEVMEGYTEDFWDLLFL
ncbi:uncharacterized protein G2W53_007984 [Senna tora]|uniref:Uncharacterized protein n=1 Tax=Senna tora TaxID=362788 RepID=A0A834X7X7_9FABA|nr:uncharacterized protein G2W53_007984 [Senna tora]